MSSEHKWTLRLRRTASVQHQRGVRAIFDNEWSALDNVPPFNANWFYNVQIQAYVTYRIRVNLEVFFLL